MADVEAPQDGALDLGPALASRLVEGGVVEKFPRRYAESSRDGFDDVGGGVLATLLDVAQVALGHAGLICKCLQGKTAVRAELPNRESDVIGEAPFRHSRHHCS